MIKVIFVENNNNEIKMSKEEFEKLFEETYNSGKEHGYELGYNKGYKEGYCNKQSYDNYSPNKITWQTYAGSDRTPCN